MTHFNISNVFAYKQNTAALNFMSDLQNTNIDGKGETRNIIRNSILSLFDGQKKIPYKMENSYDGKIDKNEFDSVSKKEYKSYIYEMRKYLKSEGKDLSDINIPSYEELGKLIEKAEASNTVLAKKVAEEPTKEKKLIIDPDYPEKYDNETILEIISKNKSKRSKLSDKELLRMITNGANKYNLDRKLLTELIRQESHFDAKAGSGRGAMGLTQILPSTAREMGLKPDEYFDPQKNIYAGAKYLKKLLVKYKGDVQLALAAYNAGMGNVAKADGIPNFKETRNYVNNISDRYLNEV